jgi:hypothetical protein
MSTILIHVVFFCNNLGTSACAYTEKTDTSGNGAIYQAGVNTQDVCQTRCDGVGLTSGVQCYAYDYNTANRQCFIHTSRVYTMNLEVRGINHYIKDASCTGKTEISEKCHILQYYTRICIFILKCVHMYSGIDTQIHKFEYKFVNFDPETTSIVP